MKPRPIPESFWVTGDVLAGKYPGALAEHEARSKIDALVGAGVRTFVDLTEDGELRPYVHLLPASARHHRVPVTDVTAPSREQVREALDAIATGHESGIVYLHCWGGCGRTGVIIGCMLVERGYSAEEALDRVDELTRTIQHKPCPETPRQIEAVREWSRSAR